MHVLTFHGHEVARDERWQGCCLKMAAYSAEEQQHMHIESAPTLT